MVWRQAIEFEAKPRPSEPDNASGTHHPGHYIWGFRGARDRARAERHLAMARRTPWAAGFGGPARAPARDPGDRTTRLAGGSGDALRAAQAIPATELRGTGSSAGSTP